MMQQGLFKWLVMACLLLAPSYGFVPKSARISSRLSMSANSQEEQVHVVVFGVGDLRTDDHGGLAKAMKSSGKVLPVVVLEESSLQNIPGQSVEDTASLLWHALDDLQSSLAERYQLPLQILDSYQEMDSMLTSAENVHVHVCDLGAADNAMGYGPFSQFENNSSYNVHSWTCRLREEPWKSLEELSDSHPDYDLKFARKPANSPWEVPETTTNTDEPTMATSTLPSVEELCRKMGKDQDDCRNTGLYGTHWGGLEASTIGESSTLQLLSTYIDECQTDDAQWLQHPFFPTIERNPNSLEHAAMSWFESDNGSNNLIKGECMTRFLAAPLLFGTVSPRRLWHLSKHSSLLHTCSLKTLVESREWHALLAARNMHVDPLYKNDSEKLQYKYWRWHGFLCRYAQYNKQEASDKEGMLLIHGFGASGSQWVKTMEELDSQLEGRKEILAPDLIGFGQSEKPPLSYTQYLWESYAGDFAKEAGKHWDSFVVGGNSIGGYTSMGVAANDDKDCTISASGAPGNDKCTGVVLMNSAGQIKTREVIAESESPYITIAQITSQDALPKCSPAPRPVARVFGNGLLRYLRPRIQSICQKLYPTNPDAVNKDLCEGILRDSLDPGAINVMISGSKLPPPRTANELLGADFGSSSTSGEGRFQGPVLVAQGMLDPLNDAPSRASMLSDLRKDILVTPINGGHCPHDELPQDVAKAISDWIPVTKQTMAKEKAVVNSNL